MTAVEYIKSKYQDADFTDKSGTINGNFWVGISNIMEEYAKLAVSKQWISVEERLPELGSTVLTYPHFKVLPFGNEKDELSHDETDTSFWYWDGGIADGCPKVAKPYPTHWMPLPEPPIK